MFCFSLAKNRFTGSVNWFISLLVAVGVTLFAYVAGNWQMLGYPIRFFLLGYLIYAVYASVKNLKLEKKPSNKMSIFSNVVNSFVGILFLLLALVSFSGRFPMDFYLDDFDSIKVETVELVFPLQNGVFVVGHGGSIPIVNYHNTIRAQRFALDISALYAYMFRAKGVLPKDVNDYAIFGLPIIAPCDGVIVSVMNELPDLTPPEVAREKIKEKPLNIAGNHVAMKCNEIYVVLAHMQQGSVKVKTGDTVQNGADLGLVGNSGNTTEPHLHIHAVKIDTEKTVEENLLKGEGVALSFKNKFLVRNSIVKN